MKIKGFIDIPVHHEVRMDYQKGKGEGKAIINDNNDIVGYIWFSITGKTMDIDMIEIIEKENGLGTKTIQFILDNYDIDKIMGQVLKEPYMRAYYFWESLGAQFNEEFEDGKVERAYFQDIDLYFVLPNEKQRNEVSN